MTRQWGRDPDRTGLVQAVEGAARRALAASTTLGLAVALVQDGAVVWAAGYGVADRTTGQPVTAATRFQAASLAKPVTAWGVLRLVESGRIGLDEPVVTHLRRWRPPPSPFDADGLTVRRLLSHTAGLSVHGYVGQTSDRPLPSIVASLSGETGDGFPVELLEAPGRGWLYSGGGYSVLQLLVEELTGRPFADYMQAEVLGPLGMTASSFRWSRTAHTARPHDADGRAIPDFVFVEQAAAGLVITAPDLALLHRRRPCPSSETAGMRTRRPRPAPVMRSAFAGFRFPPAIIVLAVRWYLRFGLSYRDVEELLAERGIEVDYVTIYRWVQRFAPQLAEAARPCRHAVGDRWFVDETYVKVAGTWRYVYRAIDQFGQVIDVFVSPRRDVRAARRFFQRVIGTTKVTPVEVVTDRAATYPIVLEELLPAPWHRTEQYANNRVEADHGRLKSRLRPMRGLKQDHSARVVIAGHAFVQNLRRGHYELAVERPVNRRVAVALDELALAI